MLDEVKCPFCGKQQNRNPLKTWRYVPSIKVSRYKCSCKKIFNYYDSPKGSWTIPRGYRTIRKGSWMIPKGSVRIFKEDYDFIKNVPDRLMQCWLADKVKLNQIKQKLKRIKIKTLDDLNPLQDDINYMKELILTNYYIQNNMKEKDSLPINQRQISKRAS